MYKLVLLCVFIFNTDQTFDKSVINGYRTTSPSLGVIFPMFALGIIYFSQYLGSSYVRIV
jgi:hypothetical protein